MSQPAGSIAVAPVQADGPLRRLLLVSYHYPPSEATGAMRWQQLTRIGTQYGFRVDAIVLDPAELTRKDPRRLEQLPPTTRTFGVPQPRLLAERFEGWLWRAWRWLKPRRPNETAVTSSAAATGSEASSTPELRWIAGGPRTLLRAWTVWLMNAKERAWSRAAYLVGVNIGDVDRPDVVVSCGPPHMAAHLAGRRLALRFGVPYAMDLRDPWSLQPRLPDDIAHPLWFSIARRAEAECVRAASLVIMNTPGAAAAMQQHWPGTRVIAALNGWDDEELPQAPWPRQFRVVYAGVIYLDRTPRPFFQAASIVARELKLTPDQFEIRLIGDVQAHERTDVRQMAREEGVEHLVRILPSAPRREVLKEYAEAALLLSLPQDSELALPSKVFEYMRFPAWILAQSGPLSATGSLLLEAGAYALEPGEIEATAELLRTCLKEFQAGRRPGPLAAGGRYSRSSEAAKVFGALGALIPVRKA